MGISRKNFLTIYYYLVGMVLFKILAPLKL